MESEMRTDGTLKTSEVVRICLIEAALGILNSVFAYGFIAGWVPAMNLAWFVTLLRIALALFVLFLIVWVVYDEDFQKKELLQYLRNVLALYNDNRWFFLLSDISFWAFTFASAAHGAILLAIFLVFQFLVSALSEALVKELIQKRSDLLDAKEPS